MIRGGLRMGEKKSNKKKILVISLIILLLAVIGVTAFILIRGQLNKSTYRESIQTAEKQVMAGNYEQAVVEYKNAIEAMPEEEDGYIGLADVYLDMGETSSAKITLQKGYLVTESPKIQYMLDGIADGSLLVRTFDDEEAEKQTLEITGEFGWNISFLQKLENYTYQDFQTEYGGMPDIVKTGRGEVEIVHRDLAATCYYSDTPEFDDIVDDEKDRPASDGMPDMIVLDSLSLLFDNFGGTASFEQLQSLSATKISPIVTDERTYVELTTGSLVIRVETDADGNVVSDNAWNEIIMTEANENRDRKGLVTGVVIDAVSGEGVPGAVLTFDAQTDTANSDETTAQGDGTFSIELEPDTYTVTISVDGYLEEQFEFEVEEDKNYSGEQFVISPSLAAGTARIVLEWGAEPRDLDSYLRGTTDNGDRVFINYRNRQSTAGGETVAELDVDERSGYGPETITIYDLNGVYSFEVVDFLSTGTFQEYGATVKVYLPGQSQPEVITMDPNAGVNIVWEVFELDHGELKVLNRAPADENLSPATK